MEEAIDQNNCFLFVDQDDDQFYSSEDQHSLRITSNFENENKMKLEDRRSSLELQPYAFLNVHVFACNTAANSHTY